MHGNGFLSAILCAQLTKKTSTCSSACSFREQSPQNSWLSLAEPPKTRNIRMAITSDSLGGGSRKRRISLLMVCQKRQLRRRIRSASLYRGFCSYSWKTHFKIIDKFGGLEPSFTKELIPTRLRSPSMMVQTNPTHCSYSKSFRNTARLQLFLWLESTCESDRISFVLYKRPGISSEITRINIAI